MVCRGAETSLELFRNKIDPNVQKKWAFMIGLLVIARVIAIAKPERIPTGVGENGTERSIA